MADKPKAKPPETELKKEIGTEPVRGIRRERGKNSDERTNEMKPPKSTDTTTGVLRERR